MQQINTAQNLIQKLYQLIFMNWVLRLLGFMASTPLEVFDVQINPLILINHILQAFFFTSAVCNLLAMVLHLSHFAYAEEVGNSKIWKLFGLFLFYYLKIWDYYTGVLYIASVFSLTIISLYVYDCCGNISHSLDNWSTQHRDLAIIFSFVGMSTTTAFIIWQIYKDTDSPLYYQYSGIYLLEIVLIVVGGMIRRRSIFYSLFGVLAINYLMAARHFMDINTNLPGWKAQEPQAQNNTRTRIPVEYVLYFLMAIDAQKRERDTLKANTFASFFKTCAYLAAYSILNEQNFQLELLFGIIFIFGLIINR